MFSKSKNVVLLWICLGLFVWIFASWLVNAESFSERLSEVGLDIVSFSKKNSISRYEVARLLNAANCEDCVQAPGWMEQKYTQNFWENFKSLDGKDFNDISYRAWVWNKKSYYYCVAYVWDNGYMAWYPSTSTKCKWNFCGQEDITTSEFYQTVLNIIQNQVREKYRVNWLEVKSWMKWLKKNSMQMKVLNKTDIDAISNANSKNQYAQTNDEFQAWLKYCMYNLFACNFQSFGAVGTWYWPVSELNVLYKEWVITMEDAQKTASFPSLNWEEAIRIFSSVYDNYANCSFNVDYDCDWITNWSDNCPYAYNRNQYDLDGDWIWNVCDDDVDWDGEKNPVWIVDDNDSILISLWKNDLDQTPLGGRNLWFSFFINVDVIGANLPSIVRFSPLTDGDVSKIEWDFWDWTNQVVNNWGKITHTFKDSGTFTVKAVATSKNWSQSFAMNKVFIAIPESENYLLNLSPNALFKNGGVEYTFSPQFSGNLDTIKWSINNWKEVTKKTTESFKTTIKDDGLYVVDARWYVKWNLKAVARLTIVKDWSQSFASMWLNVGELWNTTSVVTRLVWVDKKDVERIVINWWWVETDSTDLSQSFVYEEVWLKTIQQSVLLKNWTTLYSVATISVQNPLLSQSYAVNILWNRLSFNQNEKLSLWLSLYPKSSVLSLFTSYQAGQKDFKYNPDLSQVALDFSYVTAWSKLLTNSVEVNKCVALTNQWTVRINSVDVCETAMKNGTLSRYKCDQDNDGIPDICDDDIDWDGKKNLIWIVVRENRNCSIGSDNVNINLLKQQFWVCSLDNCPFDVNSDQLDLNNDWVGDACGNVMYNILGQSYEVDDLEWAISFIGVDTDKDWIPDTVDVCKDIPWNSLDGCPEFYSRSCWIYSSCGNGVKDVWETCQNCPQDVWVCCWNGILDYWENCVTCPVDSGECKLCWNKKIDSWETCQNCPQDVGECVAYCGNEVIERWENCKNCKKDVWECVATCGNGKIELWEDCENCPEDVGLCRKDTCGDWKIDVKAGEECDNWEKNGLDGKCTKMCTVYDPNKPKCWNGIIDNDEDEDCNNCPVDLWERCVKEITPEEKETCGNGDVEEWERCDTCEEDVWECVATCDNWKQERAEDCENCPEDVKMCRSETCGNGVIDTLAWEECDNGVENGDEKYLTWAGLIYVIRGVEKVKCTKMCTKYDPNKPKCGNGEIDNDENEDCNECDVDLWEKCVKKITPEEKETCGNGKVDDWEECDPMDQYGKNWWEFWCSNLCKRILTDKAECNPDYDWKVLTLTEMINSQKLCSRWKMDNYGLVDFGWTWSCFYGDEFVDCVARRTECWNGVLNSWEECDYNDKSKKNWEKWKTCNVACKLVDVNTVITWASCNDEINWKTKYTTTSKLWLNKNNTPRLCVTWDVKDFAYSWAPRIFTWKCESDWSYVWCVAYQSWCGDWKTDTWENCKTCPEDSWFCPKLCWNAKIDSWEECDYNDEWRKNWWNFWCSNSCKRIMSGNALCDSGYDWQIFLDLSWSSILCSRWDYSWFVFNLDRYEWTWLCITWNVYAECVAKKTYCTDGIVGIGENCENCPEDLGSSCVGPYVPPKPQPDIPDPDVPEDEPWHIENKNCNICPCEYVDFSTDLVKWDTVRAKLWDKSFFVFYRYSNSVAVENFLDIE